MLGIEVEPELQAETTCQYPGCLGMRRGNMELLRADIMPIVVEFVLLLMVARGAVVYDTVIVQDQR